MLDLLVRQSSEAHGANDLAFNIRQYSRKVDITRPEDRDTFFSEEVSLFGSLAAREGSPLRSVNVRIRAVDKSGLLRVPEHGPESEARYRGYLALADWSSFDSTSSAVLHVTLPGGNQVRDGILNSLICAKHFGATFPVYVWASLETLGGKSVEEALRWERGNFPLIERCRFEQTLDIGT